MKHQVTTMIVSRFSPASSIPGPMTQARVSFIAGADVLEMASYDTIIQLLKEQLSARDIETHRERFKYLPTSSLCGAIDVVLHSARAFHEVRHECKLFAASFDRASRVDSSRGCTVARRHIELWAQTDNKSRIAEWFCREQEGFAREFVKESRLWPLNGAVTYAYEEGQAARLLYTKIAALHEHFPDILCE